VENRFVAAAAATLAVTAVAACSSTPPLPPPPPGSLPPVTAHVAVQGQDAGTTHQVSCTQVGWSHTFDTGDKSSGTTAVVDTGDEVKARMVEIRNVNGFSGTFAQGTLGNANARVAGDTFTITGTALGYTADKPRNQIPQQFTIKVNC
jgi:lipoprotein LpqH